MLGLMKVTAAVSLVIRYRRAGSELRHQLKWLLAAAVAVAVVAVIPILARDIDASQLSTRTDTRSPSVRFR